MARWSVALATLGAVAVLGGCATGGPTDSPTGVPTGGFAAAGSSPGAPSAGFTTPQPSSSIPCGHGYTDFAIDQERGTARACLTVGADLDLSRLDPSRFAGTSWTSARSSDPAVVSCAVDAAAGPRCHANRPGAATVTASGTAGAWLVRVFVAG